MSRGLGAMQRDILRAFDELTGRDQHERYGSTYLNEGFFAYPREKVQSRLGR